MVTLQANVVSPFRVWCDGPPDYTYKAAYDEAEALLAQLNKS